MLQTLAKKQKSKSPYLISDDVGAKLADLDDEWANFRNKNRAINKWEVALLLRPYGIKPNNIYPPGAPRGGVKGYDLRWPQIQLAFKHYLI